MLDKNQEAHSKNSERSFGNHHPKQVENLKPPVKGSVTFWSFHVSNWSHGTGECTSLCHETEDTTNQQFPDSILPETIPSKPVSHVPKFGVRVLISVDALLGTIVQVTIVA